MKAAVQAYHSDQRVKIRQLMGRLRIRQGNFPGKLLLFHQIGEQPLLSCLRISLQNMGGGRGNLQILIQKAF